MSLRCGLNLIFLELHLLFYVKIESFTSMTLRPVLRIRAIIYTEPIFHNCNTFVEKRVS